MASISSPAQRKERPGALRNEGGLHDRFRFVNGEERHKDFGDMGLPYERATALEAKAQL